MSECYYCGGSFGNCSCHKDRYQEYVEDEKQKHKKEEQKRTSLMLEKAKPFVGKFFFYKKKDCFYNFKLWFGISDLYTFEGYSRTHIGFKINKMLYCEKGNSYYFENRLGHTIKKEKSDITCIEPVFSLDNHIMNPIFEEITEKEFNEVLEKYNEFNTRFNS